MTVEELKNIIRDVPDFPKPGIIFKDITTLLIDHNALKATVSLVSDMIKELDFSAIIGIESRGFIFGSLLAHELGVGFIPVRKKGKLPSKTRQITYSLEYGEDTLEVHEDAITSSTRALIVDDLLATGGTAKAVAELIEVCRGTVAGYAFVIELDFLRGREKISKYPVKSLIHY